MTNDEQQMTNQIGVAVIGTGFGQKIHIPGFQIHPRTQVVAVYNPHLDKAKAVAESHNIPQASDRLEDILAMPDVQAVSISTPPFLHYDMAQQVLQAGKHLLLEKPMTLSATETRDLYHLAKQQGVVAMPDFEFRFVPPWQLLAEHLESGYVGQKRLIKIDWLVSSRANAQRAWNWYAQKEKGGGALGAVGSHAFDYINWLFGSVRRLCAQMSTAIPERPDPSQGGKLKPVDADDTCLLMLELADGTPCQLCISSVTYNGRGHFVEVYGDRGTLVLGSSNQNDYVHGFQLWAAPAGESLSEVDIPKRLAFPQVYPDGRLAPFIRVVDQWVQSIDADKHQSPSLAEGVYSQLLMDLTHQSHQENSWVDVPSLSSFLA
ncbi:Oxidoreductase family, NAD-binding Rossmann fold protein [Coleofasciculus chthonoplastes PCC 7420]|uniref:Oxidoreductase family, NAD-binding Rossmann fold protein n=1 Tax=Coleofasciculus chthonoplastes PCC 7420 TaxID=118168 RepID=B4W4J4_9CYAN|nr:Gfo/Idh/MocA family oxidoreductase [Coleofasciculus chthonoplastes]EDX70898.1 Oxidoreductase family, NAD-binding Rossmann fold protein [Coleofasciculus chthonoplastes PCC 7420]